MQIAAIASRAIDDEARQLDFVRAMLVPLAWLPIRLPLKLSAYCAFQLRAPTGIMTYMIMQPLDISWLSGEYAEECYSFIYVRATPEQVVERLGGQWEDFTPGPFPDDADYYSSGPLGVTSIGDWTFVFDPDWLGTDEALISRLSEGTRLVSQAALGIKCLDYFYWCENGEIRFSWGGDEGYLTAIPDELVDTMTEIDKHFPSGPRLYEGPAFLLVEHLTGIRATEDLLKGSTFRWGVVPVPTRS